MPIPSMILEIGKKLKINKSYYGIDKKDQRRKKNQNLSTGFSIIILSPQLLYTKN